MTPEGKTAPPRTERGTLRKRAWQTPRILSRERLEALAVFCGSGTGKETPASCPIGPLMS